ncbi:hypothetical protein [Clostridium septicum]|uniref:Uncharacterized protein n=1 Tax=Clostridium septicum TaxID=1504 RepID=A0A9N7JHY8_CLOSE|nr:hypothetical protein [Clostridium septicum]AYE32968.1 hypothetical protein CP523_00130 [Clostridium septicum]MDU1314181.1 hypothetical protein [Clostridium septicum]QAS61164.1 hypothetical protein EI377_10770 [Clostridium septicum]UEC19517.1 hypothetical protein LK444_08770 [Clostridium septicum]USR99530.1 hypothetical protein NH397_08415 [Clostridium septicum]
MVYEKLKDIEAGNLTNYICNFKDDITFSTFFLKETDINIKKIKDNLIIDIKDISYFSNRQAALLILFKFADSDKLIYGRWYNYSNDTDRKNLELLLFQNEIPITIVDKNNCSVFTAWCHNIFKNNIREYIKKVNRLKISSMEFDKYVSSIEDGFSNIVDVWKKTKIY